MKKRNPTLRAGPRSEPAHAEIAARAKLLWERRGRPAGLDDEIWFEAERQIKDTSLARADDARFANPESLLDAAGDPGDDVDERLKQLVGAPGQRSATSL